MRGAGGHRGEDEMKGITGLLISGGLEGGWEGAGNEDTRCATRR